MTNGSASGNDSPARIGSQNLAFVEGLYEQYLRDPQSVSDDWRAYFRELRKGSVESWKSGPTFTPPRLFAAPPRSSEQGVAGAKEMASAALQDRADQLIRAYRVRGHLAAKLNPLDLPRESQPELEPSFYGFTDSDLDVPFSTESIQGENVRSLRDILSLLRETYTRSIGAQFMHIDDPKIKHWLQQRMEGTRNRLRISSAEQRRIFTRLTDAVIFEEFVQKKYVGAKTFSLEGAESLIPLLDLAVERSAEFGVEEVVMGMAHRGRLNVLANILHKNPQWIFREFEDRDPEKHRGGGDVKYHLGYRADWKTATGRTVHVSLTFNPSHLEFVNPVAMGRTRARQDRREKEGQRKVMNLLIHGDAAFIGEGVVQETLNLSQLAHYGVGGAIHVIVNNQIGFTTAPDQGMSTTYNSDIAKMLQIPIFHVNGESPEAVAQVIQIALEFRQTFHRDVVIDMYCYRRRGHNETDEPAFTQPLLYRAIGQRDSVREGYLEHVLLLGGLTVNEADAIAEARRNQLERDLSAARETKLATPPNGLTSVWDGYFGGPEQGADEPSTKVPKAELVELLEKLATTPSGFSPHPKIDKELKARAQMARDERPIHWAAAELLAFASLAQSGIPVRLTGQDCERGTFSQRHSVLHDYLTGQRYATLQHLGPRQAKVEIVNSPLSESGVMGFEYGYSLEAPDALVLWEAQYGDFCNAAQVIIDQFIVSAEDKWSRLSGLVLLLPHGFEGSGPEHSSARLERFLSLAAEDNIQVANLTTPAQYFHCLRRQAIRRWRKPLVIMTPKSLLRHPSCVSTLAECSQGAFQKVIADASVEPARTRRIVLCAGKIYYDLEQRRREVERSDIALIRVEMLYPFPAAQLQAALAPYGGETPVYWVQEEPENMGAWPYLFCLTKGRLLDRFPLRGLSRPASASPATGSASSHKLEQNELVAEAIPERSVPL